MGQAWGVYRGGGAEKLGPLRGWAAGAATGGGQVVHQGQELLPFAFVDKYLGLGQTGLSKQGRVPQ